MNPDRGRTPHSTWIVIAVTVALLGWAFHWFAGDVVRATDGPDEASREFVQEQLDQADGVPMPLPVKLPRGYDSGHNYTYDWGDEPTDMDDEPERADVREVKYIPVDGVRPDGPPAVIQCVELANAKPSLCQKPNPGVQRRYGRIRVIFYAASAYSQDLTAWKTVELTTDLDKVTWLH